ncbi:MAG: 50S ribosome-binding GTPase, partial [Dehalococcoidia bacterium]
MTIALTGNPNSGKTTLFNKLTGANQHIGNWPGVTVEKKEGFRVYKGYELKVVDLPGTYSLTAHSVDEIIARNFLIDEKPDVVVNIVDASNLERNLYLSLQLLEMGFKPIIALNMMDVAYSKGYHIEAERLSSLLGVPVVLLVASRTQGIDQLLESIACIVDGKTQIKKLNLSYGHAIDNEITKLEFNIATDAPPQNYPSKWLALKLL